MNYTSNVIDYFRDILDSRSKLGYFRINHGHWDALSKARKSGFWPINDSNRLLAERECAWEGFFSTLFSDKLNLLIEQYREGFDNYDLYISLDAFSTKQASVSRDSISLSTLRSVTSLKLNPKMSTLPKSLVENGEISELFALFDLKRILIIGPGNLFPTNYKLGSECYFFDIPEWSGFLVYENIISRLRNRLQKNDVDVILFQASSIGLMAFQQLCAEFPNIKWFDIGVALSVLNPNSISHLPWFRYAFNSIISSYRQLKQHGIITCEYPFFEEDISDATKYLFAGSKSLNLQVSESDELINRYNFLRMRFPSFLSIRLKILHELSLTQASDSKRFLMEAVQDEMQLSQIMDCSNLLEISSIATKVGLDKIASRSLNKIVEINPHDPRAYVQLARLQLSNLDYEGAMKCINIDIGQGKYTFRSFSKTEREIQRLLS